MLADSNRRPRTSSSLIDSSASFSNFGAGIVAMVLAALVLFTSGETSEIPIALAALSSASRTLWPLFTHKGLQTGSSKD